MADLPEIKEGVVVRPGDTLVICLGVEVDRRQFDEFAAHVGAGMPEGVKLLVVNAEQLAVIRAGEAAPSD